MLANALLSVACEESRDAEVLKYGALQAMALAYRARETISEDRQAHAR